MARPAKPRLRYYARFKEDYGRIHAVIRHGKIRRSFTTPIVVSKEQLSRLDTAGALTTIESARDMMVDHRLHEYTKHVWAAVNPLIASGEFDSLWGWQIGAAVTEAKREAEKSRTARNLTALGVDVSTLAPGWELPGGHNADGSPMTKEETKAFIAEMRKELTEAAKGHSDKEGGENGEL